MRKGVLISMLSHAMVVAVALFGTPKLFDDAATMAIEVELVPAQEAPAEKPQDKPPDKAQEAKPEKDRLASWEPLPEQTAPWPQARSETPAAKPNEQQANAQPQPQPQPQPQQAQPSSSQSGPPPQ